MKKTLNSLLSLLLVCMMILPFLPIGMISVSAVSHNYWKQPSKSEACVIYCYAMMLSNANCPKACTPTDVYKANGNTYFRYFKTLQSHYNYKEDILGKTACGKLTDTEKEQKVSDLIDTHPWGIFLLGDYGPNFHAIVALKDSQGKMYYSDPATVDYIDDIKKVYKLRWNNITNICAINPSWDTNPVDYDIYKTRTGWNKVIASNSLAIYSGHGTQNSKVGNLYNGDYIEVDSIYNDWGRIIGTSNWIQLQFCVKTTTPKPSAPTVSLTTPSDIPAGTSATVTWKAEKAGAKYFMVTLMSTTNTAIESKRIEAGSDKTYTCGFEKINTPGSYCIKVASFYSETIGGNANSTAVFIVHRPSIVTFIDWDEKLLIKREDVPYGVTSST